MDPGWTRASIKLVRCLCRSQFILVLLSLDAGLSPLSLESFTKVIVRANLE